MTKLLACIRIATCITMVPIAVPARAQLEGTLFTEPEERVYLDYLREEFLRNSATRDFNIEDAEVPEIPDTQPETTRPVEYSFSGAMTGREGTRIWLNGRLLARSELPEGFSIIESGASISLRIVQDGKTFVLRPGQTVDLTSGTIVENFERSNAGPSAAAPANTSTRPALTDTVVDTTSAATTAAVPVEEASPADDAGTVLFNEDDDIDGAVAEMSDAEAAALAAALARRSAASATQAAPQAVESDAP